MIAILADDLSGAAELAGIAAARGFKAAVQTCFDSASDADVIAVDTDTRLLSEAEAARVVGRVTRQIMAAGPAWIYKKTDSVLRGHVRAEIEAILQVTGQSGCRLIPANPSKGRVILKGFYWIQGVPLHETLFAKDPVHPRTTSIVRDLLGPAPQIETPDTVSLDDLPREHDASLLPAGGADYFTALLGPSNQPLPGSGSLPAPAPPATLLISGSLAAWDSGRAEEMTRLGFTVRTFDQPDALGLWNHSRRFMLAIGRPSTSDGAILTTRLIDASLPLIAARPDCRVALEGGATAMAFIRRQGWTRFEVVPRDLPGVAFLQPPGGPLLIVKPGSYPWPPGCFD